MVRRVLLALLPLTVAGLVAVPPAPAGAAEIYTVTTAADTVNGGDGALSLREAIDAANADGEHVDSEIVLMAGQTHQLTRCDGAHPQETANVSGDLNVSAETGALSIVGGGATIMQTCPGERVLLHVGAALDITATTITGGDLDLSGFDTSGGGVLAGSDPVTLTDSRLVGNSAAFGGGMQATQVTLVRSELSGNTAAVGGALFVSGSFPSAVVTDSSVVGNTANSVPGIGFESSGTATVTNSTFGGSTQLFVNNSIGSELNVLGSATITHSTLVGTANGAPLRVSNVLTAFGTVIDQGTGASGTCSSIGSTVSLGHNVDTFTACGFDEGTDHVDVGDAGLAALGDNGGAGPTYLPDDGGLLDGLIPVADCDPAVTVDARGVDRPSGLGCEPGAVEREAQVRPDGQIRLGSQAAFLGTTTYNTTGAGQTRTQSRGVGQRATFFVRAQNDGDEADGLRVRGPASANGFTVRYFLGTTVTSLTNAVTHAGQVFADVAPGGQRVVRVEVTPTAASHRNVTRTLAIRTTSTAGPTVQDVVKAAVRRV